MKHILFYSLILLALISGYRVLTQAWWAFVPATLMILALTFVYDRRCWRVRLGLICNMKQMALAFVLTFGVYGISNMIITSVLPSGYQLSPINNAFSVISIFFQCLNEEMVFRGLLLAVILQRFGPRSGVWVALSFVVAHLLLYACNTVPENRGLVSPLALGSLFLFALTCQNLFLYTGSIVFPLALHLGWNLNRFAGGLLLSTPEGHMREVDTFNLIEGTWPVFLLACSLWCLVCGCVRLHFFQAREKNNLNGRS